uniref:Uncharacterized protein n=1 Tax=Strongyloides venezuelensis TaxID=75913 RepID=A0A0K0FNK6_STRVS
MLICVLITDLEASMTSPDYPNSTKSSTKIVEINPFCYNDPKYKCLCSKIHIKVGTYFFAYLTILAYIAAAVLAWVFDVQSILCISITILAAIAVVASLLLIYGVKKEKRQLFLPYLIFCVLSIIVLAIFTVLCLVFIINRDNDDVKNFLYPNHSSEKTKKEQHENLLTNLSILITIALLFLFITIWGFFIVFRTYKFIGDILVARKPIRVKENTNSI